jgi:putative transposase
MGNKMLRAHRIRLHPTPAQEAYFLRAAGCARFAYNWALARYKELKAEGQKGDWNALKKEFRAKMDSQFPFLREITKCAPEQAIADLRQAISTYYKVKKANPKAKVRFPGFRRRAKRIGGFGLANDQFRVNGHGVFIPKLGEVNLAEALRFHGKIMSGRVKEKAGRWYLTVVVECEPQPVASRQGRVGIDFGVNPRFATLSTGEVYETQGHFRRSERKLKALQRGLARKQKGSKNRARWKLRVARQSERVANQRLDFIHRFTHAVASVFALVCIEDLVLKALHRTRLAKSFVDVAIGETVRQLEYKTVLFGGWLQKVDRFFPSTKRCHVCGSINEELELSDREWTCPHCGTWHDRDFNASQDLEMEGVRLLAGSGSVGATAVELAATTSGFGQRQAGARKQQEKRDHI